MLTRRAYELLDADPRTEACRPASPAECHEGIAWFDEANAQSLQIGYPHPQLPSRHQEPARQDSSPTFAAPVSPLSQAAQ